MKTKRMTEEEIRDRLRIDSPELIGQVFSISEKFYDCSLENRKDIDDKVNMLLGITGICFSVFFAVLAIVFDKNIEKFKLIFVITSLICLSFLSLSIILLFFAVRARSDFRVLNEEDILKTDILEESAEKKPEDLYNRHMAAHLIDTGLTNQVITNKKAFWLLYGQYAFFVGLCFLIAASFILCFSLFK